MSYVLRSDITSWGRVVRRPQWVATPRFRTELPGLLAERHGVLATGLHRSYGDSALNEKGSLIHMAGLDRLIDFDRQTGRLRAEAGISLDQVIQFVVPHGFFLPVTPGTRFVTLGGAIANDVHGKNHHQMGTIGCHVIKIGLLRGNGSRIELDRQANSELFAATIGGLGLTGIVEWAEICLAPIKSSFLNVETMAFGSIDEFWHLADGSSKTHEHTVAWVDCASAQFGRGIFTRADWSSEGALVTHSDRKRLRVLVDAPKWLLSPFSVKSFNLLYYALQRRRTHRSRQHYREFFYPLDAIANWNRLYGKDGFWQYQCVLPTQTMREGISALMKSVSQDGQCSSLSVLKTFGEILSPGLLSFPMKGATLALDFPNRGDGSRRLFARLDAIVREAGGRLYSAKDGRIPNGMWRAGYPQTERFRQYLDPQFESDFWRRVAA